MTSALDVMRGESSANIVSLYADKNWEELGDLPAKNPPSQVQVASNGNPMPSIIWNGQKGEYLVG